ncbi:MAG: hypothetical protein GX061_06600 [Eubacteriaceae bacterium]|jgi:hypothetical protein|nr:hypothetical protein [Eubacteriaceae bacterium]
MGFAGNWECVSKSAFGDMTTIWYIKEENGVYSGISEAFGQKTPFTSVELKDNKFVCKLTMEMNGMKMDMSMEGDYFPEKDIIVGASKSNMGATAFTGKRMA